MTPSLAIPYARDSYGKTYIPQRGQKGLTLYCPDCGNPVLTRTEGKINRPHYAHGREYSPNCCFTGGGESALHRQACHYAMHLILTMAAEHSPIQLHLLCDAHQKTNKIDWVPPKGQITINQSFPNMQLPQNYRPDIIVYTADGEVDLCIEIVHTHPMSDDKVNAFNECGIRWVEIDLADTDIKNPKWDIVRHGGFNRLNCCIQDEERKKKMMNSSVMSLNKNQQKPITDHTTSHNVEVDNATPPSTHFAMPSYLEPKEVYLDDIAWSKEQICYNHISGKLTTYEGLWKKWNWRRIADHAISAMKYDEDVKVTIRSLMKENNFFVGNEVVKNFLLELKIIETLAK